MYTIEDGTGKVDVRKWINRDEDAVFVQKRSALREGVYVRVIGELRAFQDQKSVTSNHIRPLDDFNEITYHILETIYVHVLHTHGRKSDQTQKLPFGLGTNNYTPSLLVGNTGTNIYMPQKSSAIDSYHPYNSEFTPLQANVSHSRYTICFVYNSFIVNISRLWLLFGLRVQVKVQK
jgi:hypothetical protein